jgi:signal transduction histidine kinase
MPSPSLSDTASEAAAEANGKLNLLIVDDEEGPRQSLKIVFKSDYNVIVASNGLDAIALAHEHPVDIAVLDILMQGMSGVDLLRELKQIDPLVEVVMLTAYETIETARQALRHGASDYLNKPFDISTMRAAVTRSAQKRRAALEIHSTRAQLVVLQREIENQRMQEEMARTKGEIYASVLHDINSPLTVIAGFIELLNRSMETAARVEGEQLETMKGDLKQLHGQVARCFEISRRYLSFLNSKAAETKTVGVRQILVDLRDLLMRHPSTQGNDLIIRDLENDVVAEINGTDLLQILLNMTFNALQCTERPHRVEVEAHRLNAPFNVGAVRDGVQERLINGDVFANRPPLLAITVKDNGPGIAPDVMPKLFEQAFTTKSAERGTGLGLSIVKRLIREASGAVHLQTELGGGSQFTLLLQAREG